MTHARVLHLFFVAACTLSTPAPAPPPLDRIAAECALLAEAALRMGPAAHPGLREGCPGETARDTRPLAEQSRSLRAANAAALPPSVTPGTRAEAVFRRMITRGVSVPVATALAGGETFAEAAR
jgi:hypothetical protein